MQCFEYVQLGFSLSGFLQAVVMMHFEHQVSNNSDPQPPYCFVAELDETVSPVEFGSQFQQDVLLVPYPGYDDCCLCLRSVELEILTAGPVIALCCAGFESLDHLVHIIPGSYPSKAIFDELAFSSLHSIVHPCFEPSGVWCEENRRYG